MRLLRGLGVLLILGVVAVGAAYGYYAQALSTPHNAENPKSVEFMVPKGSTLSALGPKLVQAELLSEGPIWKIYLKLNPGVPQPKAGRHRLSSAMTIPELTVALAGKPLSEDEPLTMVEGWRLRDADAALAEKGRIEPGEYIAAAKNVSAYDLPFEVEGPNLAGYLLPETYMVPVGKLDTKKLVQRQLDAFHKRFVEPNREAIENSGRSLRTLVIMASLLEREEPNPVNRPDVAGVLFKRLDDGWALGVDATSRFTLKDWNDRRAFLKKLRDPNDPYNTRLKVGLPPGPIGAPSLDALNATLRPKKNPYWYYLHDRKGRIHFARNAKQHERNRRRYNVY